jgi:hypothetical protein
MMNPTQTDKAALRRAIIRVWPDYYSWPEKERERHRAQRSREDDFRLRQALVPSLFGRDVRSEEELEALLDSSRGSRAARHRIAPETPGVRPRESLEQLLHQRPRSRSRYERTISSPVKPYCLATSTGVMRWTQLLRADFHR